MVRQAARQPVWSGGITAPLASLIPAARRAQPLSAIKAIHTAIFFSIAGAILVTVWDGVRGRPVVARPLPEAWCLPSRWSSSATTRSVR